MKWIVICQEGNVALLQSETNTQFVVAHGYDLEMPEDEQWTQGRYFCYWDTDCKTVFLQSALEYFRKETEEDYIPRYRMDELATKFKDKFCEICTDVSMSDDDFEYELEELELEPYERKWLGFQDSDFVD